MIISVSGFGLGNIRFRRGCVLLWVTLCLVSVLVFRVSWRRWSCVLRTCGLRLCGRGCVGVFTLIVWMWVVLIRSRVWADRLILSLLCRWGRRYCWLVL